MLRSAQSTQCHRSPGNDLAARSNAFSLIEVVLAVGVISFALVGIIGLFPVAMQSALDSQRETQATFIARSLFNELQRVDGADAYITVTAPGKDLDQGAPEKIALNSPGTKEFFFDTDGGMLDSSPNSLYVAEVAVEENTGLPDGLAQVTVTVGVPADAPVDRRKKYPFVTLINFTPPAPAPTP